MLDNEKYGGCALGERLLCDLSWVMKDRKHVKVLLDLISITLNAHRVDNMEGKALEHAPVFHRIDKLGGGSNMIQAFKESWPRDKVPGSTKALLLSVMEDTMDTPYLYFGSVLGERAIKNGAVYKFLVAWLAELEV